MFTAEDYATTIKVLEGHSFEDLADGFEEFRERAARSEDLAYDLGMVVATAAGKPPTVVGARIISRLLDDGWTPPEGIL